MFLKSMAATPKLPLISLTFALTLITQLLYIGVDSAVPLRWVYTVYVAAMIKNAFLISVRLQSIVKI